jgi:type IV secretion system protein VirB4
MLVPTLDIAHYLPTSRLYFGSRAIEIRSASGTRYAAMVKQGKDVVVARIDLSGMEDIISVLSGRAETVALLDEIRAQVGDDVAAWLPVFNRRIKEL